MYRTGGASNTRITREDENDRGARQIGGGDGRPPHESPVAGLELTQRAAKGDAAVTGRIADGERDLTRLDVLIEIIEARDEIDDRPMRRDAVQLDYDDRDLAGEGDVGSRAAAIFGCRHVAKLLRQVGPVLARIRVVPSVREEMLGVDGKVEPQSIGSDRVLALSRRRYAN